MRSFPRIQSSLSETEKQFTRFVERHVASHHARYAAEDLDGALPGDTVEMTVTSRVSDDVLERRHVVEFMSLDADGHWQATGCIGHSAKEIEGLQGRCVQVETTFEIAGPGIPRGRFARSEVEPFVRAGLDGLRAARLLAA